jgi:uncharacterized protein (DUF4415 family)
MKKVYDFSKAKCGPVIQGAGKTRITIYLDDAIIERFKMQSEKTGKGYQTLINEVLRENLELSSEVLTAEVVRKMVREELKNHR